MSKRICNGCNKEFEYNDKKRRTPKYCHRDCYINQLKKVTEPKRGTKTLKMAGILVLIAMIIFYLVKS